MKMKYLNLSLSITIIVLISFIFIVPAYAVMNAGSLPNRDPLQPIPEDTFPNYEGNINFKAKKVQDFTGRQGEENFGNQPKEIKSNSFVNNTPKKKQTSNWPWAVAIVLFIGGVAGFIYAQAKKRK